MAIVGTISFAGFDYPVPDSFTNRELAECKRIAGVLPGHMGEALAGGDVTVFVWLLLACAKRAGAVLDEDKVWDADVGAITFVGLPDEEEPAPSPPESPAAEDGGGEAPTTPSTTRVTGGPPTISSSST